jgi:hypothetical protein
LTLDFCVLTLAITIAIFEKILHHMLHRNESARAAVGASFLQPGQFSSPTALPSTTTTTIKNSQEKQFWFWSLHCCFFERLMW